GGLAGGKGAEALRERGFDGTVTLVAAESHPPYERPPLSKSYLAGTSVFDDEVVHHVDWYRENNVDLRMGTVASAIDLARHRVRLDNGDTVGYDKLLLATGSVPRRLRLPGADADGVLYLRTVEDSDAIRAQFGPGKRLAIIG